MAAAAVVVAGSAVTMYGQRQARKQQQKAEEANAAYYREQAQLAEEQKRRSADIFQRQSAEFLGDQKSIIAKSGVDFSGSLLSKVVESTYAAEKEHLAILRDGDANVKLAGIRATSAQKNAKFLGSSGYAAAQDLGTLLNAGGTIMTMKSRGGSNVNQSYSQWDE